MLERQFIKQAENGNVNESKSDFFDRWTITK